MLDLELHVDLEAQLGHQVFILLVSSRGDLRQLEDSVVLILCEPIKVKNHVLELDSGFGDDKRLLFLHGRAYPDKIHATLRHN